jgi:hypothetical protein
MNTLDHTDETMFLSPSVVEEMEAWDWFAEHNWSDPMEWTHEVR